MSQPSNDSWEELFADKGSPARKKSVELHLDLYNFDEPGTEESRYILTSPRSLEACSRFGIKPVELLHKSFEEFVEEFKALYDTNYSHDAIFEIYQEHDRQRLRKLRLCREERERIMKDREREQEKRAYRLSPEHESKEKTINTGSKISIKDGHSTDRSQPSTRRRMWDKQESIEIKSPRMMSSPDKELEEFFGEGSLNVQENQNGERKKQTTTSSSFDLPQNDVRTYGESSDSEYSDVSLPRPRSRGQRATWNKPPSSTNSSPAVSRRSSFSVKNKPKKTTQIQRSSSLTNVASHLPGKTAAAAALMSEKDQRIIDLMLSRHEETEREKREKRLLQQGWSEQRRLENQLRKAKDKQKQTELFLKNREKERKSIEQSWGSHQQRQFEAKSVRHKNELQMRRDTAEFINAKSDVWKREFEKQKQIQVNKLQSKKLTEMEKKRQQEERLRNKEKNEKMWRSLTDLSVSDKIDRASKKKTLKASREQTKIQMKNELEKVKHAERKVKVEEQFKEEEHSLRQFILDKHSHAADNFQRKQAQREAEIEMNRIKKAEKIAQLKEQQKQLNEDLEKWQKNVQDYRTVTSKRAEVVAAKKILAKSVKVHEDLTAKQLEHQQNLERVKKEEELYKQEVKAVIDFKDQRTELVTREKEEVKKLGRQVAHASQTMRDMIREQTLKSSFDKMDEQAQMQARVGGGPRSYQKNISTLSLG